MVEQEGLVDSVQDKVDLVEEVEVGVDLEEV